MADHEELIGIDSKAALYANVYRICPHCKAPGHWHDVVGVNVACYDPKRKGEPVGTICPACGKNRPDVEPHGKIARFKWLRWW